jgi:hypothetical protein
MDLKTLEYMEERAKKARKIVEKIDKLLKNIEGIEKVKRVDFINNKYRMEFDSSEGDLTDLVKAVYIEAAREKIQTLEKELVEL